MSTGDNTFIHLLAGGLGGTAGAIITCPLEVVKTRLQSSSVSSFAQTVNVSMIQCDSSAHIRGLQYSTSTSVANTRLELRPSRHFGSFGIFHCLKHIVTTEGPKALLKGLGPNLVGVAPQRAIYFYTYAQSKVLFNGVLSPDSPQVHLCSAACAGFVSSTITNPIWFIKTRLQLDHSTNGGLSAFRCIQQIYGAHGIRGFYKGITASYYGISETVIHLVIYEAIKARLSCTMLSDPDQLSMLDFIRYMAAGASSKTIATCLAYPHEVARTRLREEGNKFNAFWQTLFLVFREDGVPGLYRGLGTQLVRQIPNTAIMMATYEAVVYICQKQFNKS